MMQYPHDSYQKTENVLWGINSGSYAWGIVNLMHQILINIIKWIYLWLVQKYQVLTCMSHFLTWPEIHTPWFGAANFDHIFSSTNRSKEDVREWCQDRADFLMLLLGFFYDPFCDHLHEKEIWAPDTKSVWKGLVYIICRMVHMNGGVICIFKQSDNKQIYPWKKLSCYLACV